MDAATRVLVVANRTADSPELLHRLADRHARSSIMVTMLAPAAWEVQDPHDGTESACRRLRAARRYLQGDGVDVSCVIGDPDPMTAFASEWQRARYNEVIVATLPTALSKWLRIDLPRRIEHAAGDVPVTHVVVSLRVARAS
jgi:hypothetical protein